MSKSSTWIIAVSFVTAAAGFLLPFWPLEVVGVLLSALSGRYVVAVGLGVLLDIAYGTPIGRYEFLIFPFTLLAVLGIFVRYVGMRVLRKGSLDHL